MRNRKRTRPSARHGGDFANKTGGFDQGPAIIRQWELKKGFLCNKKPVSPLVFFSASQVRLPKGSMELHLIALIPVRKSALSRVQTHSFFCFYMSISKEINTSPLLTHTQARLEQQAGPTSAITHRIHRFIFSNQLQFSSILMFFLPKKLNFPSFQVIILNSGLLFFLNFHQLISTFCCELPMVDASPQAAMASTELRQALQGAPVAKVERGEALKENKEEMDVKYLGLGDLWRSTPKKCLHVYNGNLWYY